MASTAPANEGKAGDPSRNRRQVAVGQGAKAVVSVVLNAAQTEAVLFGEDGCAATMAAGSVFVSSATMAPSAARDQSTGISPFAIRDRACSTSR